MIVVVLVLIATMLGSTAAQFNEALRGYQTRVNDLSSEISTWLAARGVNVDETAILSAVDPAAVMGVTNQLVAGIGDTLSNALLIMFTVMFMLLEVSGSPRKLAAMGGDSGEAVLKRIAEVIKGVNRYVAAKALVSLVTGVLVWIGLELVGLDFAPLWGFIAFALNFVPNIGWVLAAVPAVVLAMLQLDPNGVLLVIAIYLVVNYGHRECRRAHGHGPARGPVGADGVCVAGVLGVDVRSGRYAAFGAAQHGGKIHC